MVSATSSDGTFIAVSYALFVALIGAIGFSAFAYRSRSSRVESARKDGMPEQKIQKGLAFTRRIRNYCGYSVVIAVLGAISFTFANARAT